MDTQKSNKKPRVSMIAAVAGDRAIGLNNELLWHIPEDLAHFKRITLGHPVIMGRNTFFSLERPLPGRKNIVLTLEKGETFEGATAAYDLEEAIKQGAEADDQEIFIIGGAAVYQAMLPYAERLYLTIVPGSYKADTYFPDYSDFKRIIEKSECETAVGTIQFLTLEKE